MQTDPSARIIFILSSRRSGSTLLEMLLGSHPELWSMGEVQLLPRDLRERHHPCGCGKSVGECSFWRKALRRADLTEADLDLIGYYRSRHPNGKILRPNEVRALGRFTLSPARAAWVQRYGAANLRLFRGIASAVPERSKPGLVSLIDGSKDIYRCNALIASGLFRVRVIHLVKDPRAFVHSMIRHKGVNKVVQTVRKTLRWQVENALAERVYRKALPANRSLRLSYEDLASQPDLTLARLWKFLRVADYPDAIKRVCKYARHDISGVPKTVGAQPLSLDERWRKEMPMLSRSFINLVTGKDRRQSASF